MWKSRSHIPELIDLGPPHYSIEEYNHCLITLDRIGRWLGGDAGTFMAIDQMSPAPISILDVGCGGGTFTSRMARKYPQANVVGVDLNPHAIQFAKSQPGNPSNVHFENKELTESPKSYDLVVSTLVCHHLSDDAIIEFIQKATQAARKKVIFNDLHRHPLGYYLFKGIGPFCFRNRLVQNDGPLSVLRSFTYQDWIHYLEKAGIKSSEYSIKWHWAFRWVVAIDCERR